MDKGTILYSLFQQRVHVCFLRQKTMEFFGYPASSKSDMLPENIRIIVDCIDKNDKEIQEKIKNLK